MKNVFVTGVILMLGGFFSNVASLFAANGGEAKAQIVSLKIDGMTCGNCVKRVSAAVCDLPGVVPGSCKVEVGSLSVALKDKSETTQDTVESKIKELNYTIVKD